MSDPRGILKRSEGASPDPQAGLASRRRTGRRSTESTFRNAFIYDDDNYATMKGSGFELDPRLSRHALNDEDNPQNQFRKRKQGVLYDYDQAVKQQIENHLEALKAWKDAKKARRKKAWTSAAISMAMGTAEKEPLFSGDIKQNYGYRMVKGVAGIPGNVWGDVKKGAKGFDAWLQNKPEPKAQGGLSPDNVPALLMGGEFVMSKQAVSRHGRSFFEKLNEGSLPKYEKGGYVSENLSTQGGFDSQSQNIDNNINITVNMSTDKEGGTSTEDEYDDNRNEGNSLGEVIKDVVVKTIIEQTRQGGVLSKVNRIG